LVGFRSWLSFVDGSIKKVSRIAELTFFGQPLRSCRPTHGQSSAASSPSGSMRSSHFRPWLLNGNENVRPSSARPSTPSGATKRPSTSIAAPSAAARAAAAASAGRSADLRAAPEAMACSRWKLAARVPAARAASSGVQSLIRLLAK
jgi:hypothetical protein